MSFSEAITSRKAWYKTSIKHWVFLLAICLLFAPFIATNDMLLTIAVSGGSLVVLGALVFPEFGISFLLAMVILFQRAELFTLSIPLLGGGLKPTDILLVAILAGWATRTLINKQRASKMVHPITYVIVGFVGWATLSAIIGIAYGNDYKNSFLELRPILHYLLFLPILCELDLKSTKRIIYVVIVASMIASIRAIILYSLGIGELGTYTGGAVRVMDVGFSYPLIGFLLAINLYIQGVSGRFLFVIIMVLCLCALTVTFQRSAWLGLTAAILFLGWASSANERRKLAIGIAFVILFAALAFAIASIRSAYSPNPIVALGQRLSSILAYRDDSSAQHRLREWETAFDSFKSSPIVGKGLGFTLRFYSPMYSDEDKTDGFLSDNTYIHNSYVWVVTKLGIIGLGLFVAILIMVFRTGIKQTISLPSSSEKGLTLGLTSCIVALAVVSFFGPMFSADNLTPFLGFAFGAIYHGAGVKYACAPEKNA